MSYTSRYSSSYSNRYGNRDTSSSSPYGDTSSRYTTDSTKDYSSSRYGGDYSSRYTSKDYADTDDIIGSRYSSRYRSKTFDLSDEDSGRKKTTVDDYEHYYSKGTPEELEEKKYIEENEFDTEEKKEQEEELPQEEMLELCNKDLEQYDEEEEEETVQVEEEQIEKEVEEPYLPTPVHEEPVKTEEPAHLPESKVRFQPTIGEQESESRRLKSPIENIVPKKRVSDLIARFNTGNVDNARGESWKKEDSSGGRQIGKLSSTAFH